MLKESLNCQDLIFFCTFAFKDLVIENWFLGHSNATLSKTGLMLESENLHSIFYNLLYSDSMKTHHF